MRKRRQSVVWLPADINNRLNSAPLPATIGRDSSTIVKAFTANPLGAVALTEEIPIVRDFTKNNAVIDESLADLEDSGYRLRRIVGKLFFLMNQDPAAVDGDATSVKVTAGFIIRRMATDGTSQASTTANGLDINTCTLDNIADPWIWRRAWVFSNRVTNAQFTNDIFPGTNVDGYGSALDGPHVDAKTARVVGPEERLYLSVTTEGLNGNAQGAPSLILMFGDLRVLASMRTSVGNRRNASR